MWFVQFNAKRVRCFFCKDLCKGNNSRRFNSNVPGFQVVVQPEEHPQLKHEGKCPGDLPRENVDPGYKWLTSARMAIVSWLSLNHSDWPLYDLV